MPRWYAGSYSFGEGTTTSPDRRKPKKQRLLAAHSILASYTLELLSQTCLIRLRISGVIGSLHLTVLGTPLHAFDYILQPLHFAYLWVTHPPTDLFEPHRRQVALHSPWRQTFFVQQTHKEHHSLQSPPKLGMVDGWPLSIIWHIALPPTCTLSSLRGPILPQTIGEQSGPSWQRPVGLDCH